MLRPAIAGLSIFGVLRIPSMLAGTAETAGTARALREIVDNIEGHLNDRHHDELGNSFHWIQRKDGRTAIP